MKTKHTSKFFALLLAILMVVAIIPFSAITAFAAAPAANLIYIDGGKNFNTTKSYYKNGATETTNDSANWNAYYDDSTGVLTLKDYNGGEIYIGGATQNDLSVKLIGTNIITTSDSGIYNNTGGNITITAEDTATLKINSTSSTSSAYGIALDRTGGQASGTITISGKANLEIKVTTSSTDYNKGAYGIFSNGDLIIQDSASVNCICTSKTPSTGVQAGVAIYAPKKLSINTTGQIKLDTTNCEQTAFCIYGTTYETVNASEVELKAHRIDKYSKTISSKDAFVSKATDSGLIHRAHSGSSVEKDVFKKGTGYTLTLTLATDAFEKESNTYLAGETVELEAFSISGVDVIGWVASAGIAPSGTGLTATYTMPAENATVTPIYDLFAQAPKFEKQTYNSGTITFISKVEMTNIKVLKEDGVTIANYFPGFSTSDTSAPYNYTSTTLNLSAGTYRLQVEVSDYEIVTEPFTISYASEFNFVDNDGYDVADGYAGDAINEINISSAVSGGTAPYTFSKESGPSWLNVSADGKITGTRPMTAQAATTATIKVTDGASASKTITIAIGAVSLKTINAIDFTLSGYAIGNTRYDASVVANTSGITLDDDGSINGYAFYTATDTKLGNYDAFEANSTYKIKVCYTVGSGYELGAAPTLTLGDATFVSNTKSGNYYTATFTLPQLEVATNNLTGITVTTPPTKTAYVVGENFDKTGMVVTATYEDSSTAPITDYTITNGTALTAGQTTVTISYTKNMITKTAIVTITVHEHTYDDTFNGKDATNHWKECTATDCPDKEGSKKDVTAHSESTPATCIAKATCVCGQEIGDFGTHTFATDAWNEEVPATCVATGTKAHKDCSVCEKHFAADGVTEIADLTIAIDTTNHDMATEWTKTAEGHYHSCKRTGCEYHDTLVAHTSSGSATETTPETCTVCGYVITPALGHTTHTPKTEWKSDADNHWHECTGCEGQQLEKAAHADTNNDEKCDACGKDMPTTPGTDEPGTTPGTDTPGTDKPGTDEPAIDKETDATDATDATDDESESNDETDAPVEKGCGGCGSSAALSALAIVAVVGSALVIKKKED